MLTIEDIKREAIEAFGTIDYPYRADAIIEEVIIRNVINYLHTQGLLMAWNTDMDSAPRDGTRVLLMKGGVNEGMHTAFFLNGVWSCGNRQYFNAPTAWMPLPRADGGVE